MITLYFDIGESDFFFCVLITGAYICMITYLSGLFNRKIGTSIDGIYYFKIGFNESFTSKQIPPDITHVVFNYEFDQDIKPGMLHSNINKINFGNNFNSDIYPESIPRCVTHLIFGYNFNQTIKPNIIPPSVKHLVFGHRFNSDIMENSIPNGICKIEFGHKFDKIISSSIIPSSTRQIVFSNYRQIIPQDIVNNDVEILFHVFNKNYPKNMIVVLYHVHPGPDIDYYINKYIDTENNIIEIMDNDCVHRHNNRLCGSQYSRFQTEITKRRIVLYYFH